MLVMFAYKPLIILEATGNLPVRPPQAYVTHFIIQVVVERDLSACEASNQCNDQCKLVGLKVNVICGAC